MCYLGRKRARERPCNTVECCPASSDLQTMEGLHEPCCFRVSTSTSHLSIKVAQSHSFALGARLHLRGQGQRMTPRRPRSRSLQAFPVKIHPCSFHPRTSELHRMHQLRFLNR
jgi:hypothetical protein